MKKTSGTLLLLLVTLIACNQGEECGGGVNELGDFQLLPTSREVFPYEEGVTAVIFTDSVGKAPAGRSMPEQISLPLTGVWNAGASIKLLNANFRLKPPAVGRIAIPSFYR